MYKLYLICIFAVSKDNENIFVFNINIIVYNLNTNGYVGIFMAPLSIKKVIIVWNYER